MIPHGGGSTPATQTLDTHLNQHVRRKYTAKEGAELIRKMREEGGVPRVGEECSIVCMYEIMKDVASPGGEGLLGDWREGGPE